MKAKNLFVVSIVALLAGFGGWQIGRHAGHDHGSAASNGERAIRFYQCSMHPQVKSDKPGKCTICGMELSPIYDGQTELAEDLVTLSPNIIQVVNVQTAPVRKAPLKRTLRVAGMIDDDDTKHRVLSAYIDGRIEKLFVNYIGAEVKEGEPLATFYSPELLTAEREYRVIAERKPRSDNAKLAAEHQRLLNAAAQRLQRLGLTPIQIAQLPGNTNSLARTEILAPMSGTVVSRSVYEGQYVKEGDPLFEIADFSTMWFLFDAYEQDLPWLKPGQKVEITTPSVPGRIFTGQITFIDPNLNDLTRSARVRVELENPLVEENGKQRRLLLHKLYADGIIHVEFGERLVIPRTAVLNPGGKPIVYVDLGEGAYQQREVRLGIRGNDQWEVLDGVSDGDLVVTYGNTLIDAQAQLNQSTQSPGEQHGHEALPEKEIGELSSLTEEQRTATRALLQLANQLGQSLANDNLNAFNAKAASVVQIVNAVSTAFAENRSWQPLIEPIAAGGKFDAAPDLSRARKAFHPFSMAVVEFAKHLRSGDDAFADVKIFRCPMVNQAVPGAPRNGFWIQLQTPLRNPYFGADMLECGTEVAP